MDSFINLAKQGLQAYESSPGSASVTGGAQYNAPHQQGHGSPAHDIDNDHAINHAAQSSQGDPSLFQNAMDFVKSNTSDHHQPINEEAATKAHQQAYQNSVSNMSEESMGTAAAMQALKMFTSGGGGGGSGGQSQLIGMAMAEASKLFNAAGGDGSGKNQQSIVNSAATTVMKLLVQSKMQSFIGGENSGGLGGLMSLATKFF